MNSEDKHTQKKYIIATLITMLVTVVLTTVFIIMYEKGFI